MAIPDFQSLMLPLLKMASDQQEHTNRKAIEAMALQFELTDEEGKSYCLVVSRQDLMIASGGC